MVHSLAWQLLRRLPNKVDADDLISEGQVGLLRAARDFNSARGAEFSTYAYWRIRGAMMDWIRSQSWFGAADYYSGRLAESNEGVDQNHAQSVAARQETLPANAEFADPQAVDPATAASQDEVRDILRQLVGRLDGLPKQILEATLLKNQTLEEAGHGAGVHKGTAQRAQVRGFEQLAAEIRQRGLGDMEGEELRRLVFKNASSRRQDG
ncbi:MAG TPA: sigma-70 family RNA polymerase sigma factor [Tepidisphaeraceae bacterium]|jgi:RNA polymerase sigma factor for flagellar operon FliA|nr:sigma-70 family RNA polymerase sigma factor [Tepidisphaeraceae bacterium]